MTENRFDRPGHDLMADYIGDQLAMVRADMLAFEAMFLAPHADGPRFYAAREAMTAYRTTIDTLEKAASLYRAVNNDDNF